MASELGTPHNEMLFASLTFSVIRLITICIVVESSGHTKFCSASHPLLAMAPSDGKTFRLRGIPAGLCKRDVESLVQNTLNCNDVNIRVRSLASDLDSLDEDVATVELSPVPRAFQSTAKADEWCLDTVYNDEDLSLLFDTNFLGPTPLHTPSHEQWNLE